MIQAEIKSSDGRECCKECAQKLPATSKSLGRKKKNTHSFRPFVTITHFLSVSLSLSLSFPLSHPFSLSAERVQRLNLSKKKLWQGMSSREKASMSVHFRVSATVGAAACDTASQD